jgi:Xaa-Pro aminopeptidase
MTSSPTRPLLLLAHGSEDPDFLFATRFPVEWSLYIRFGDGDDVLIAPALEVERARSESSARTVVDYRDAGWRETSDTLGGWAQLAAGVLRDRGLSGVRVSPRLPVAVYQALEAADIQVELERDLFRAERRRKSPEQASFIHAAQRAAEAACIDIVGRLAQAEIKDELLWLEGRPLTSERLRAGAQAALAEIGYGAAEMIIAGSPGCAIPHYRGEGQLRANAPIIIDLVPRGNTSHYHGDLTRTVVVGEASDQVKRMHEACERALEAAIAQLRAGADGREVHRTACRVLVEAGFGTYTQGFEGNLEGPRMSHSTGHGVGLEVHEAPNLRDLEYPLVAGDVVTVEPGLYLGGLGGVRVEDSGLVTADGFRNFTALTRSLRLADYL